MAKLYIASSNVVFTFGHLYLVYDPNGILDGDELIIRGGPKFDSPLNFGPVIIENIKPIASSEDSFMNEDGSVDTPSDRNFTLIAEGQEATDVCLTSAQVGQQVVHC